ncbi:hypothetical protein FRC01_007588, partial [Tulasnella sp. 417]
MPRSKELVIDVAHRIRDILDDYPMGPAILREILQNTDDAGGTIQACLSVIAQSGRLAHCITTALQKFILDPQKYSAKGVVDPALKSCRGAAIIAWNDKSFQSRDWDAICNISNSSKKGDYKSAGKFGLGFCACYHVTDYPQVLSGSQLLILDPNRNINPPSGCIEFSTRRSGAESDRDTYPGLFYPFMADEILPHQNDIPTGTAIRLPLRPQNSTSRINPNPVSVEAARDIFNLFIKEDLPEVMLFLKHITAIEVSEISGDGKKLTVLATARVENAKQIAAERSKARGWSSSPETGHYRLTLTEKYHPRFELENQTKDWVITHYTDSFPTASRILAENLNRINSLEKVTEEMISDKLFPHVALAFPRPGQGAPSNPTFCGRLFTLLPLPIFTHLPLHIHATLARTPSRQNLQSAQENGTDLKARLRTEWNRLIFSHFVPEAWASLMEHLISKPLGIYVFDTWPSSKAIRDDGPGYMSVLPQSLLKKAAVRAVWPLRSSSSPHKKLTDIFVTSKYRDPELLSALESCDVSVVAVPPHVFDIIDGSEFKERILTPETVVSLLRGDDKLLLQLEAPTLKILCDYIVTANDINLIQGLPIIPDIAGGHISLLPNRQYILGDRSGAKVFQSVAQDILAADSISPETKKLLLDKSDGKIQLLDLEDVAECLRKKVGLFSGARRETLCNGVSPSVFAWLIEFWAWLDTWERLDALVEDADDWDAIQDLYALPVRTANNQRALRSVANSAIDPLQIPDDVLSALVSLEVPVFHGTPKNGGNVQMVLKKPSDLEFILRNITKTIESTHSLPQSSRKALHDFFTARLSHLIASSPNKSQTVLDPTYQTALKTLPIFPLLHPGERSSESLSFGVASTNFRFVSQFVQVIPNIRGVDFFDFERGVPLCRALGANEIDEIAVLEMAIEPEAWRHLHPNVIPGIIRRLIYRLSDFQEATRDRISELDIVDVGPSGRRKSPKCVVDPFSPLAGLFDPEDEALPVGEFAMEGPGSYLQQLRNHQMLQTTLTDEMAEELVDYIIEASQGPDRDSGARKASRLLALLDKLFMERSLEGISPSLVEALRQKTWIPIGGQFYQSSDCWDSRSADSLLCDWVLRRVSLEVASPGLRKCLGWDLVPFDVLRRQMRAVTSACPECQVSAADELSARIKAILKTLALRLGDGDCTQDELETLLAELGDAKWVPVSEDRRVEARRAWLPSDALEQDLGSRFFPVSVSLLKEEGMRELLTCMRLPKRPSVSDLHLALSEISEELSQPDLDVRLQEDLIRAAIDIGIEICRDRDLTEAEQPSLLVPVSQGTLVDAQNVLYNAMGVDTSQDPPDGKQFAHPLVSPLSASKLGMKMYCERLPTQLESVPVAKDTDGLYVGEDTTTRIKDVLLDFGINHSIHEWIANAVDAGASMFKLLVDEVVFPGNESVSTKRDFPASPALVVYNDARFSEDDFQGIGQIGKGGKGDKRNTIGRFGLGALSFYHFTELPMIISGRYVVLLDPSRKYILGNSGGTRLTLKNCFLHYPDQVEPLEGIFGFCAKKGYYDGTLFRLPLRSAIQAGLSTLSTKSLNAEDVLDVVRQFYSSASLSLLFTSLSEISAERRTPDMTMSSIWRIAAVERTVRKGEGPFTACEVEIQQRGSDNEATTQVWLVTRSSTPHSAFPSTFESVINKHRLSKTQPNFGLALNLSAKEYTLTSTLFASLPLPVSISLPVHLHATWILTPDRRSIRNDASIQSSEPPLESQYNKHIMETFIPALYLKTLELLNKEYPDAVQLAWPRKSRADGEAIVTRELYHQLSTTRRLVLRTADNGRIAPKDAVIHLHRSPEAVRKLMTKLRPHYYVPEPHFDTNFFERWEDIRYDSPQKVSVLLRSSFNEVRSLCCGDTPQITLEEVESIVCYLLDHEESLVGIPLLPLGDGKVIPFGRRYEDPVIFGSGLPTAEKFFGSSRILNPRISPQTARKLLESTQRLNIEEFDVCEIKRALQESPDALSADDQKIVTEQRLQWHKDFLAYCISKWGYYWPRIMPELPLIPTENGNSVVSLEYAQSKSVWCEFKQEGSCLSTVFLQLGIPVVNSQYMPRDFIPLITTSTLQQLLNVLEIFGQFRSLIPGIPMQVQQKDWAAFAATVRSWVRDDTFQRVLAEPELTDVLLNLPIFDGWQGSTFFASVAASKLVMLPASGNLATISQFFPQTKLFAPRTAALEFILKRFAPDRILSFERFFALLKLPRFDVAASLHTPFQTIISLVASNHKGQYQRALIPNGDGVLRKPGELFDHQVEAYVLRYQDRPDLFIHPAFRDMVDDVRSLGLRHEFGHEELLEFIEIVDEEAREGKDVTTRAEWIWSYINEFHHALEAVEYDQIREMRFIPRRTEPHCPDPKLLPYVADFPMIVSPDELSLDKYASLCWTQLATFAASPTEALQCLYPELGQPTGQHVVEHLVTLATAVSDEKLKSDTLFYEVEDIYDWLKQNPRKVQWALQRLSTTPIWLNIDSKGDSWKWKYASQLVFDLPGDREHSFKAKDFLVRYSSLVIAAGATEHRAQTTSAQQRGAPDLEPVPDRWNMLRINGRFFDICFKPEGHVRHAHLERLAAVTSHFDGVPPFAVAPRYARASGSVSHQNEVHEYPLPDGTSIFAVDATLDYVYTGSFDLPTPRTHEESAVALRN